MGLVRAGSGTAGTPDAPGPTVLVAQLAAPDAETRRRAAMALAGVGGARPALLARVGEEDDSRVRHALLTALAHDVDPAVVRELARHLGSEDAGLRNAVAEALSLMPTTADAAREILADPDPDVRAIFVAALAAVPHPDVPLHLLDAALTDGDPRVAGAALAELAAIGHPALPDHAASVAARFPADPFIAFVAATAAGAAA